MLGDLDRHVVQGAERGLAEPFGRVVDDDVVGDEQRLGHDPPPVGTSRSSRFGVVHRRGEEHLGVGMLWLVEEGQGVVLLDELAGLHDGDAIADVGDDTEVVSDQDDGHADLGLQPAEQVEDVGLDGDVEGGGGLVGDQQHRVARHGAGDQHPLGHAAGDLVWIGTERALGIGDPDHLQQFQRPLPGLALAQAEDGAHRLDELEADRERRVEVAHRLLRDVGDLLAPDLAVLAGRQAGELAAAEADRAGQDAATGGQQPHDGERRLRLARPGFADEAEDLAFGDVERHVVDDDFGMVW